MNKINEFFWSATFLIICILIFPIYFILDLKEKGKCKKNENIHK